MTFEEAKAFQKQLSEKVDTDTAILKEFDKLGTNQFGYANDQVRELPELNLTDKEIEKLKNTTIVQLAMILEDGLINACTLNEDMSVFEFIKDFLYDK